MATKWYGKAAEAVATKKINLTSDTFKVMLVSSSYTPNQDTHAVKSDVTGEITGTGYTAGGKALSGLTLTQSTSKNTWTWDANDLTWTGLTGSFRYAVIYDDTEPSKPLVGYSDLGAQTATSQDLTIKWEYRFQDPVTMDITTTTGILELGY